MIKLTYEVPAFVSVLNVLIINLPFDFLWFIRRLSWFFRMNSFSLFPFRLISVSVSINLKWIWKKERKEFVGIGGIKSSQVPAGGVRKKNKGETFFYFLSNFGLLSAFLVRIHRILIASFIILDFLDLNLQMSITWTMPGPHSMPRVTSSPTRPLSWRMFTGIRTPGIRPAVSQRMPSTTSDSGNGGPIPIHRLLLLAVLECFRRDKIWFLNSASSLYLTFILICLILDNYFSPG